MEPWIKHSVMGRGQEIKTVYHLILLNGHEMLCFIRLFVHSGCSAALETANLQMTRGEILKCYFNEFD